MSRSEFPKAVKVARLKHATAPNGVIYCEGCGVMVKPGEFDFDHDRADGLAGKPTFENCRVLCVSVCHPRKTAADVAKISRAKRREALHLGAKRPKQAIRSAGFPQADKPKREPRAALPPRRLYERI